MSPRTSTGPRARMGAEERRELVLQAATRAFAHGGFAGTSTDAVAREAGVSQPYVVRIFGTKLDLFVEVYTRAVDRIGAAFSAVLDDGPFDPRSDADWQRMGAAYARLLEDRDFLLVMMHGYTAAGTEPIGAVAREGMGRIFQVIKRTGCTDDEARDFIATGMLLNVMIAMNAPAHVSDGGPLSRLTQCAFGMLPGPRPAAPPSS